MKYKKQQEIFLASTKKLVITFLWNSFATNYNIPFLKVKRSKYRYFKFFLNVLIPIFYLNSWFVFFFFTKGTNFRIGSYVTAVCNDNWWIVWMLSWKWPDVPIETI